MAFGLKVCQLKIFSKGQRSLCGNSITASFLYKYISMMVTIPWKWQSFFDFLTIFAIFYWGKFWQHRSVFLARKFVLTITREFPYVKYICALLRDDNLSLAEKVKKNIPARDNSRRKFDHSKLLRGGRRNNNGKNKNETTIKLTVVSQLVFHFRVSSLESRKSCKFIDYRYPRHFDL